MQPPQARVRLGQVWPAGFAGRLMETVAFSSRRLRRRPVGSPQPVWSRGLTLLLLCGAVAVALLFTVDSAVMNFMLSNRNGFTAWLAWLSDIGRSEWYLVPALLVYLATAAADWRGVGYDLKARLVTLFGQAAFVFGMVAFTGIAVNIVKLFFGRARPAFYGEYGAYHFDPFVVTRYSSSFPSGHATTIGTVAAILMIWFPRQWLPIAIVGLMLSALRIPAAAHYPSDVTAGYLFGFIVTIVAARFFAVRRVGFRLALGKLLPLAIGFGRRKPTAG
ncbi:phosphatase PAP2 family protein [Aminobacter anthyllidis]|uniref:Phosphatase PAP2 family protein n=1 Tax=Aminobacter anthyllidis TaxID=1035067 RepID=A0A9X1A8G6_9HYPH|nr:phosphatase PAP2 family protein [Aminobacter anthyllidis]